MSRISIIAPTYLPSRRANTIQVMKMAQAMTALGHQVCVFVPGTTPRVEWHEIAHQYGLQHRFDLEWLPAKPERRRYDYGISSVSHAQQWGAELVYTRLPQAAALASFLRIPTIYEIHDIPQGNLGPWLFRRFIKGSGARRLVVITRSLMDSLTQEIAPIPSAPFTIIAPDGVDLARYIDLPSPEDARKTLNDKFDLTLPDQFTVGYTGHLYSGRGINLILDIAAQLQDVTFLLVGGNPKDVKDIQQMVVSRRLANVTLTGFIPNTELPKYQAACSVLLMPYQHKVSASSGGDIAPYLSPMKLFEYLACGRGIISSDLPVLREILNSQNAILLPPGDADLWAAAIKDLQNNPNQLARLADKAKQDSHQYSWDARAEQILAGLP